jgi:hypothetical protein
VIAYSLGILERALEPFPEALAAYKEERQKQLQPHAIAEVPQPEEARMTLVN